MPRRSASGCSIVWSPRITRPDAVISVGLLRHPAVATAAGICYGRSDQPLVPGWRAALPGWLDELRPVAPSVVFASPLSRCRLPAEAIAGGLGVDLVVDARLAELDFGAWDGLRWDDVPRASLDDWAADPLGFAAPAGETGAALIERAKAVVDDLRAQARSCLLVSHGGPLRLIGPMLRSETPDLLRPAPAMGALEIVSFCR